MIPQQEYRDQVIAKLKQRGVRFQCELCSKDDWSLVDRPIPVPVASGSLSPPYIPSVAFICNNCGNIKFLALGALDLAPGEEVSRQKESA